MLFFLDFAYLQDLKKHKMLTVPNEEINTIRHITN